MKTIMSIIMLFLPFTRTNNEVLKNINNIKEEYNVNIKIKEETNKEFPDFNNEIENNIFKINLSLKQIEELLNKFNKEFFNEFFKNDDLGINIYLTSKLSPKNYETQISNPAAYSLKMNNEYIIVLDINQNNIQELLCHELLHNIELNKQDIFEFWDNLNPANFYYNYSYTEDHLFNYTLEDKRENVYFIDQYSQTYPKEDRARIFENICTPNTSNIINDYPNLYQKAIYLKEEILRHYPSLKSTSLFNNLK